MGKNTLEGGLSAKEEHPVETEAQRFERERRIQALKSPAAEAQRRGALRRAAKKGQAGEGKGQVDLTAELAAELAADAKRLMEKRDQGGSAEV